MDNFSAKMLLSTLMITRSAKKWPSWATLARATVLFVSVITISFISKCKCTNPYAQSPTRLRSLSSIPGNQHNSMPRTNPNAYHFPDSEIVLDMATLSHAVYRLRNKVQSCQDGQARNKTVLEMVRAEQRELLEKLGTEWDQAGYFQERGPDFALLQSDSENRESSSYNFKEQEQNWMQQLQNQQNSHQISNESEDIFHLVLPNGTSCLYYSHDYSLGRQVLIVRSTLRNYIAVAYAGTDDWTTALSDGDILTTPFGPDFTTNSSDDGKTKQNGTDGSGIDPNRSNNDQKIKNLFESVPDDVRVHRGFNNAVFQNDGFSTVLDCIISTRIGGNCSNNSTIAKRDNSNILATDLPSENYQLYTTGHSLGAADSMLLGAALHLAFPIELIQSINFGCPKVGNLEWGSWMNQLQTDRGGTYNQSGRVISGGYEVFRFVNKIDLIPRLPELLFQHAGHTLQMSVGGEIEAYYDHFGNEDLGYAGVPFGWGAAPYALLPLAIASHPCSHYVNYLECYRPGQNSTVQNDSLFFVREFERVGDNGTGGGVDPP